MGRNRADQFFLPQKKSLSYRDENSAAFLVQPICRGVLMLIFDSNLRVHKITYLFLMAVSA